MTQVVFEGLDLVQSHDEQDERPARAGRLLRPLGRFVTLVRAVPNLGTYLGVTLAAAGGVLLIIAWGRTAGVVNVALQMPYLISAGCTGLGLVAVGLTCVSLAAKRADATERTRQLAELREVLAELRSVLEPEQQ